MGLPFYTHDWSLTHVHSWMLEKKFICDYPRTYHFSEIKIGLSAQNGALHQNNK